MVPLPYRSATFGKDASSRGRPRTYVNNGDDVVAPSHIHAPSEKCFEQVVFVEITKRKFLMLDSYLQFLEVDKLRSGGEIQNNLKYLIAMNRR